MVFCTTYALILPAVTLEQTAYCGIEPHTHDESCYERQLVCGLEEQEAHVHTDACYQDKQTLICDQEANPGHIHDESCIQREQVLNCSEDHEHTDACYQTVETYTCGLAEGEGAHIHGPECFMTESVLVCGLEETEEGHVHTDDCYEDVLICQQEEHEHTQACYSNPEADLETSAVWESSVSGVTLTGVWSEDVIAIAQSQLGYEESTQNYIVTEEGTTKGITRYGQWYGDPYGDWCAMFVSFCLHYAEVEDFPLDANCQNWIGTLRKEPYQRYFSQGTYDPKPGDLIFFNNDGQPGADHIGIVVEKIAATDTASARIRTIEGNSSDRVQYVTYSADDSTILGYGALPENELAEATDAPEDEEPSPEASGLENEGDEETSEGDSEEPEEDLPEEAAEGALFAAFSLRSAESTDATISIHVEKQWVGDAAYTRPETLTVELYRNGEPTGETLILSADNDWSSAFTGNFPKYDENGKEIEYTILEEDIADYLLVSNDYTETASSVDLTAMELWVPVTELEAGENYLVISGLSGTQSLYRAESTVTDGVLAASVTVNEGSVKDTEGNTYTNYILLSTEDATSQSYYLTWNAVPAEDGMNLQSNVCTAWNGETRYLLSGSEGLKVTGNGTDSGAVFTADGNGAFQSQNSDSSSLYLFKQVSLDVSSLPDSSYTRDYTLVNRYEPPVVAPDESKAETTSVEVTKEWNDEADHSGDSVTVWLTRDGVRTGQSITLNEDNDWTATFDDLPVYDKETGTKYVYNVEEEPIDGYQAEYQYEETEARWLPTNTFEDGVTYLIVTSATTGYVTGLEGQSSGVAWTSGSGAGTIYVSEPDESEDVWYDRYITDEEAQKHTAMQWTAEYKGLIKGEQVGYRYAYGLKNVFYEKYLKNTGQGDWASSASGKEMWFYYGYTKKDANGDDAKRQPNPNKTPESDWNYILGSMNDYFLLDNNHTGDANAQGAQTFYLYRRYEPKLQVTITNSPIEETSVTVRKEWAGDNPGSRPESIEVQLLANGENTDKTLTLTADNGWYGIFENLPVADASGNEIEYTVSEASVDGYTASYFYSTGDGSFTVVITNTAENSGYVLPETGGTGTTPYTVGGILLIVIASMLLIWNQKQRSRRHA